MNSWTKFLSLLLVVQIALSVALISRANKLDAFTSDEPLLGDLSSVNKIAIFEKDQPTLNFEKVNNQWVLSDKKDLALSAEKLKPLTETLMQSKKSFPVGKTTLAAKQFKAVEGDFERKIVFSKDDAAIKTLFVGSSPTFKKVHARVDGDDNTYVISANAYELSTKPLDWFDKEFLQIPQNKIAKIIMGNLTLVEKDGKLEVDGLKENEETNQTEVGSLVQKLSRLTFVDLLTEEQFAAVKDKPVLDYSIQTKDNESFNFKFFGPLEDDFFAGKVDKYPYYFKFRKSGLDTAKESNREKVVQLKKAPESVPVADAAAAATAAPTTEPSVAPSATPAAKKK